MVWNKLIKLKFPLWRDNKADIASFGPSLWWRANTRFYLWDLLIWNIIMVVISVSLTLFVLVYSKRSSNWRSKNTLRLPSMFKLKWENLSDQSVSVTLLIDRISRALYQISTLLLLKHLLTLFLQSCNFNYNNYYHTYCRLL